MQHWNAPEWEGEPLPLRQATARLMVWEKMYEAVEAWADLEDNADLGAYPYEDDEYETFHDSLEMMREMDNEYYADWLKEKFNIEFKLTFWSDGWRDSIIPSDLPAAQRRGFPGAPLAYTWDFLRGVLKISDKDCFGSQLSIMPRLEIEDEADENIDEDEWTWIYPQIKNFVDALKFLSERVKNAYSAEAITSWWQEEREHLIESGVIEIEEEDAEELEAA